MTQISISVGLLKVVTTHHLASGRQDWKSGNTASFGNVRAYQPTPPPPQPGVSSEVDLGQFAFKLVKVEYDMNPSKKGWDRMKVSIPVAVRQRYVDDPIHAGEWRSFLADFDEKHYGVNLCWDTPHITI